MTLFLPDFIPGSDQCIDYGLDIRADCKCGGSHLLAELPVLSHLAHYSHFVCTALIKCCLKKVFKGQFLTFLVRFSFERNENFHHALLRQIICVFIGCFCAIFLNHRLLLSPCSVRRHTKHAFSLGAGHILPPAVRLRRPTPQSPPPSSPSLPHPTPLFLLLPSLVLPVSPSFPRPETEIV